MIPRVVKAEYITDYKIYLRFADGAEGEVNLAAELEGQIFEPLKDRDYFRKFQLNQELHTITWPNGADFAPEFLYDKVKVVV